MHHYRVITFGSSGTKATANVKGISIAGDNALHRISSYALEDPRAGLFDKEFAVPRLETIQQPTNVHFKLEGSKLLASEVTRHIRAAMRLHTAE